MVQNQLMLEDKEGEIVFEELEKIKEARKLSQTELDKLIDFGLDEWVQIFLRVCNKPLKKIVLFKELFIFGERTGLNKEGQLSWYVGNFGPHSTELEKTLDTLIGKEIVKYDIKIIDKNNEILQKNYSLSKSDYADKLLKVLPSNIKKIIGDISNQFSDMTSNDVKKYVYFAYPKFNPKLQG